FRHRRVAELAEPGARPAPGRSSGAMRHPDRSNRRAVSNPMPLAAPVTIATRLADRAIPASVLLRPAVDGRGGVCRSRFCPHVTLIAACHLEEIMEQRWPNGRERLHPYLHGEERQGRNSENSPIRRRLRKPTAAELRSRCYRQILARAPFDPGAVVEAGRLLAEHIEREPQDRGGDAGAAARHDRLIELDAARRN